MDSQSQSPPTGSGKPRKTPKPPQKIDGATWLAIEKACCSGLGWSAAAKQFNVSVFAIMQKARRNNWPVGSRIQRRIAALQEARHKAQEYYKPYEEARNANEKAIEAVATNWSERGEAHRQLAFTMAHGALRTASKAPPPIESWRDIDLIDRCARRNAGLDDGERNQTVNIGMQMIQTRLEAVSLILPKDALPGSPSPQPQSRLRE